MSGFKSWRSYWDFDFYVSNESRHFWDTDISEFLESFLSSARWYSRNIPVGTKYWRSQLGYHLEPVYTNGAKVHDVPVPYSEKRMKPLDNLATEGRLNPKGIPCLYMSDNVETSISETRAWPESLISVAEMEIMETMRLVGCSIFHSEKRPSMFKFEPDQETIDRVVWEHINKAFSRPIEPNDQYADYAPTQILAELVKHEVADGIIYSSSVSKGKNIAVFGFRDSVKVSRRRLFEVTSSNYCFNECENPPLFNVLYKRK